MSKTKTRTDIADSGIAKQAGLSLLGVAVGAGSRNKKLPKGVRRTLADLRSTIVDAEKKAKRETRSRKAKKARKRVTKQLQDSAKARSKTAGKKAAKTSAKASGKVAKVSAKGTAKVGKATGRTASKGAGPVLAVKSGKKAASVAGSRRRQRKARRSRG